MRSYKLDEFVAHSGAVNCLRIGRNTAGVLATGGEDKKVNLWRIGQPHVLKSLTGLQSSVECVTFDATENQVAAGGANGTVKVWDLDSGKVSRSLTGHRSNCLTLEFHPIGPFLVTGSLDTNAKVWDLRRKECITTFKGHASGVCKLAVSPDGKWVASGSENGELKVWDIASARVLRDDWRHEQRVTGIEFHPYEFIMATSSADRTVRVWDLELWEPVEALGPEATGVRAIAYHRDGRQLLCATADALKVWGCEPAVHHDTVPIDWRQLGDMHLSYKDDAPRAVGCCCSGSSVGVFLVDLRKVAPFCGTTVAGATGAAAAQQQMGLLRSAVAGGGTGDCAVSRPVPSTGDQRSLSQQHDKDDYGDDDQQQQQQRVLVGAQPQPPLLLSASNASTKAAGGGPLMRQLGRQRTPPRPPSSSSAFVAVKALQPQTGQLQQQQQQPGQLPRAAATDAAVPLHQPPQMQQEQQRQHLGTRRQASDSFPEYAVEIRLPPGPPPLPGAAGAMAPPNGGASGRSSRRTSGLAADASAAGLHALSVTDGAVLPVCSGGASSGSSTRASAAPSPRAAEHAAVGVADAAASGDAILAAMAARPLLKAELARMAGGLQLARGFVVRGNLEGAYRSAAQASDAALASMLVEAVSCRQDAFELSTLEPLIKLLELLLSSGVEAHAAAGLSALSLVLRGPGATVREVCAGPGPLGVDLSYEARKSRCSLVKLALEGLGMRVGALSRGAGALAARARLVSDELRAVVGGGV